jgi:hypothetical protein
MEGDGGVAGTKGGQPLGQPDLMSHSPYLALIFRNLRRDYLRPDRMPQSLL